jgi:hypothetical protein
MWCHRRERRRLPLLRFVRWIVLDFLNCSFFSRDPSESHIFIHSLQNTNGNPIDVTRLRSSQPMPMLRTWETLRGNPYTSGTRAVSGDVAPPGYSDHRTTTAIHHGSVSVMPPPRAKKATIITVRSIQCFRLVSESHSTRDYLFLYRTRMESPST